MDGPFSMRRCKRTHLHQNHHAQPSTLRLGGLSELRWNRHGGHPAQSGADCSANEPIRWFVDPESLSVPVPGTSGGGQFSVRPARSGGPASGSAGDGGDLPGGLGDLWVRGDRGGQGLCTPECAELLNGGTGAVRDVAIRCETVAIDQLQLPAQRVPRVFASVEASCRLMPSPPQDSGSREPKWWLRSSPGGCE